MELQGPHYRPTLGSRSPLEWGAIEGESPVGVTSGGLGVSLSTARWISRGKLGDIRLPTLNTSRDR